MPTHNSDTPNSDISQNSDTLFALTKMSLFGKRKIFPKKTHCFSLNNEPKRIKKIKSFQAILFCVNFGFSFR